MNWSNMVMQNVVQSMFDYPEVIYRVQSNSYNSSASASTLLDGDLQTNSTYSNQESITYSYRPQSNLSASTLLSDDLQTNFIDPNPDQKSTTPAPVAAASNISKTKKMRKLRSVKSFYSKHTIKKSSLN